MLLLPTTFREYHTNQTVDGLGFTLKLIADQHPSCLVRNGPALH
jgi:hypothetical protein